MDVTQVLEGTLSPGTLLTFTLLCYRSDFLSFEFYMDFIQYEHQRLTFGCLSL